MSPNATQRGNATAEAQGISRQIERRLPGAALVCIDERGRFAARYIAGEMGASAADLSPKSLRILLGVDPE